MSATGCTVTLSAESRAVCAVNFTSKGGCAKCPLRTPCLVLGHAPARTFEELDDSRAAFNAAVGRLLSPNQSGRSAGFSTPLAPSEPHSIGERR